MNNHWHEKHRENLTIGQQRADSTARLIGSWPFIIWQSGGVHLGCYERDRLVVPVGPLSIHPTEPGVLGSGCLCRSDYYDGAE